MADPESAPSCQVSLLVPHPTRVAVLVADEGSLDTDPVPARLPVLRMGSTEPLLSEILSQVDVVDADTTPVLRQVITSSDSADAGSREVGELCLLVEFEPGATEPPAGWAWLDLEGDTVDRLEPETSRAAVAAWVRERAEGWAPLRPAWSRPGWFARASSWMVEQMAADGRPAVAPPRQHQLWGVSVVLRAPAAAGDAFFKGSPEIFRHEGRVTAALAARMPGLVPDVVAVDDDQGWMLMRDLGAAELGEQDESLWHEGLVALAGIQQRWLGRTDELVALGLPFRPLTDLAEQVEALRQDADLMARMGPELRESWPAESVALAAACRRLDEIGPGMTLVHGDFHPWNVTYGPKGARVFDWTDAAVSHPGVDLATYLLRTEDNAVRRGLLEAWVQAWSPVASEESLREAAALGLVVGALYQVQTYRHLLPTIARHGADDGMADADVDWIERTLIRHRDGLESTR